MPPAIALLATTTHQVEEPAESSVWVTLARRELDLEDEVLGIGDGTVGSPAVGEQPHDVVIDRIDAPIAQHH